MCLSGRQGLFVHELSLMDGVTKTLKASAAENGITKITKIHLIVGQMTMAVPDALQYAFEVFQAAEEIFSDADLEITEQPVRAECKECHQVFDIKDSEFVCPSCGSSQVKLVGGRELYVDYYEGD